MKALVICIVVALGISGARAINAILAPKLTVSTPIPVIKAPARDYRRTATAADQDRL